MEASLSAGALLNVGPQNTRPLAIFPEKENEELLAEFVPKVEEEIKLIKTEGVDVKPRQHAKRLT